MRITYPSDISREQFNLIEADLKSARKSTKPPKYELYDIFCAILYLLKEGCSWRGIKSSSENAPCSEKFNNLILQLATQLKKHKGKKLYGYLQKDIKNTVDDIVKKLAKDSRIANFYAEWNNINRQKLSIYHDKPDPDIPLEYNKEFRSIKNAIIKAVSELDSDTSSNIIPSNSRVTNMVTLWVRLLGDMINDSYQKRQSKLKAKIEKKKRALGIGTDHTVKDVKNDEQNFTF